MDDAPAPAAPGAPVADLVIMRAVAHPARMALLEHLADSGPATATECAEVVGLSPSAVSYHLRALARAGLVEAAPGRGDGRERLWRRSTDHNSIEVDAGPDLDPEVREARQQLVESVLARDDTIARQYMARIDDEPEEWREAMFVSSTLVMTAAELKALETAIKELIAPYRRASRPAPPEGARPVSAVIRALPR